MNDTSKHNIQTISEKDIEGMTVPDVVKHLGWETIKEFDNGEAFYGNQTPHGQNLYLFNIRKDHMAQDIVDDATASWRTEEELFRFWVSDRNNGMNSLTNDEIVADSKIAIQMYHQLADAVKMAEKIQQAEKVTDMNEFSVKFDDCEYDAESDTMRTTGKASFGGKEYVVSFTEHDGRAPVINISNDNVEFGYANGETIDGWGLGTHEWQDLYHAADTIYRTIFEKADEFQRAESDGRIARLNYVAAVLDYDDINVFDVHKNEGNIGDLIGKVRIDDETLHFTADRDGNVMQLALSGEHLQDPRNFGFTDYVANLVYDAIEESVTEYVRNEEIANALVSHNCAANNNRNHDDLEM